MERPLVGLVTTQKPVAVDDERADVFFVLLAPDDDPHQHLRTLAHVGGLPLAEVDDATTEASGQPA